jgi:hypothetical protein
MNTRYHKYPMAPRKEPSRSPARPLRISGSLEGVANTFGRYLPQKSRMVLNTAATAQRAAQEMTQSAYIRGTIAQEELRHGGPHEDPFAASGTVAAGAGLADQLQELEALLHRLSAQAAMASPSAAGNPTPRAESLQETGPSQTAQSNQTGNHAVQANQVAQMASLLSAMTGQQALPAQDTSPSSGNQNNGQLSAMMPFLLQAMGGQSGTGAAQDPMAAMMPLLMQSMMGQQSAEGGGQSNNMAAMMPLLMSAMGGQSQGAAGQGGNMAAMMPLLMSAMGGQGQNSNMASLLPLLMQSMGSSNH